VSPGPCEKHFIFWQKGGGFDRNLWNAKAIHDSIRYFGHPPEEHAWQEAWRGDA